MTTPPMATPRPDLLTDPDDTLLRLSRAAERRERAYNRWRWLCLRRKRGRGFFGAALLEGLYYLRYRLFDALYFAEPLNKPSGIVRLTKHAHEQ